MIGIEPDPTLWQDAIIHTKAVPNIEILHGSAEHIPSPLKANSVDIVHARWAYFFGEGAEKGLAAVMNILKPGGVFIAIDNSWRSGDFAKLLKASTGGNSDYSPDPTDRWWKENGVTRIEISNAGWSTKNASELASILSIEFPKPVVDSFLNHHEGAYLSYAIALFVIRKS